MSFYVTTPIYYVNATPHIGNAYTTIAADILARHHRQRGEETFFLTGTDEHGSNIPRVAAEAGLDLRAFVDGNAAAFQEMTRRVNASNDFFVRTTDERHKALVQEFVQRIYEAGDTALGRAGPLESGAGRVRLGRRPDQLLERARLRASGRGPPSCPLARGAPPTRKRHPQIPLRHLAGASARGGARRPEAALRPRLPAARRAKDVEIAGGRDRPARRPRRLRRRSAALLPLPRRDVRTGRKHLGRGTARAIRARARQRPREPPFPNHGHDRPLSRGRASCRLWLGRDRRDDRRARTGRRGSVGQVRSHRRSGDDLDARAPPQPVRRADVPVGARPGRGPDGRARRRSLRPRRRPPGDGGCSRRLRSRDVGADPGRPRAGRRSFLDRRRRREDVGCLRDWGRRAALSARGRSDRGGVIDTHAHLDAYEDASGVVERAREAGVTRLVAVGSGIDSCRSTLAICEREEGVFAALGLHPHQAGDAGEAELAELRTLLEHPKAIAVGETGLDHYRDYAPRDRQAALFRAQI